GGRPAGTSSRLRPGASAVPNPLPDRALGSVPLFLRAFLLGDRKKRRKEIMMESNSSLKQWLAAGLGIACLVILGVRVMNSRHSELFQKSGTSAPDFSFQERSGKSFSSDELKGKVWVVDFIFTTCAGTCPILSAQMKRLQDEWKDNPDFKLVSLTVDPKRDTAAALKKYA